MTIREFKNIVPRTLNDLGSPLLNSIHACLGMGSEIMCELTQAFQTRDEVNLSEELADAQWFGCAYAITHSIYIPEEFTPIHPEQATRKQRKDYYDKLRISLGKLQDYDKSELAYKKVKCTPEERAETLYLFFTCVEFVALDRNRSMKEARATVHKKLKIRFPEKFDYNQAVTRNLNEERAALEEQKA